MSNNTIYNYWGKSGIPRKCTEDDVSFHLLLYHCLDVAAMGQVLLQRLLQQDAYEDMLTQNITHDKDNSLSLITFFLALHDIGKFSKGFQNNRKDVVNILHGQLYNQRSENHEKIGFYLWQKMWPKVWEENWLSLDQNIDENDWKYLLDSWLQLIMNHHNRNQINDFSNTPDNLAASLSEENIATACSFAEKAAKLLLSIKFKKNLLKLQNLYGSSKYISWFLQDITVKSDRLILHDDSKYFPYCSTSIPIEHYWHKALAQAKSLVEHEKVDCSGIYEDNPTFFKKVNWIDEAISGTSKAYSLEAPRAYEPWTKEDDEKLIAEYKSGKTTEELMELLGRQRGGINSRLKKLGIT